MINKTIVPIISLLLFSCMSCHDSPPKRKQRVQKYMLVFKKDKKPSYKIPPGWNKKLIPSKYKPLDPSRKDGKPTFSNDWFENGAVWKDILASYNGKPNLRYLEVGVYEGRSFLWVFQNILTHASSSGVAIDVFFHKGLEARFRENLKRAGIDKKTTILKGFSNVMLRPLKAKSFDLIYIDGSHTGYDVLRDAVLCWDLLKEGGMIIFDDYQYSSKLPRDLKPMFALHSFITLFREELQVLRRGRQLFLKKIKKACPGTCSTIGPYHYYWYWDRTLSGDLYDPRSKTRVPLTTQERRLIEFLIRSRPIGWTQTIVKGYIVRSKELRALRKKLGI